MINSQIDFASLLADSTQTSLIELVIDSLSDPFFIIDQECRYLVFNSAHKKNIKMLFDVDIEKGKLMCSYLNPLELRETFQRHCELALQGKSFVSTNLIGDANLEQRWIETNFQPIFNEHQEVIAITIHFSDITDHKQIENELRDSQALYSSFVEHIPAGVFRKDLAGRYIYVNSTFCQLKGLRNDDIIGKSAFELANYQALLASFDNSENHRSLMQGDAHHQMIIENGKPVEVEEVYPRPDGSLQYLKVIKSPVFSANGEIIGSQGIQFDITDHKLIEHALIDADRQHTTLISNLPGFVYRCANDRNWTMEFISDGCLNITGYTPDDFINNKKLAFNDIIHPDYQEAIFKKWDELLRQMKVFKDEYPIITATHEIRWVWEQGRGVFDDNGKLLHLEGFITDVTDRKGIENALRESEQRFRNFFENSVVAKSITNLDGSVTVNQAFCDLIGYSKEELKKIKWKSFTHPDDIERDEQMLRRMIEGISTKERWEKRYIHHDGTVVWVDISSTLQFDNEGNPMYFISVVNNVTDRKIAEELLREKELFFEDSQRAADIGSYRLDIKTGRWNSSEVLDRIFGIDAAFDRDIDGWLQLVLPDDQEMMSRHFNDEVVTQHKPFNKEYRIKRVSDGEIRWVHGLGKLVDDERQQIISMYGTIQDITTRKITENILRESEQKFHDIFDFSVIGLSINTSNEIINANQAFADIVGYNIDELLHKNWRDISHPDDIESNELVIETLLRGEKKSERWIQRYIHKNGSLIWAEKSSTLLLDSTGNPLFFLISINDITEQVESVSKLRESEERFRRIFEQNFSVMFILDFDTGKIVDANPAACDFYGWSKEEMLQKTIWQINVLSEDECREQINLVQNLKRKHFYFTHRKADGSLCEVDVFSTAIEQGNQKLLHSIIHDITEQKKAERILVESERRFRDLLSTVKLFSIILDMNGNIIFANNFLLHATGWKQEEIIGGNWFELFLPVNDPENINKLFFSGLKSGKVKTNIENYIRTKSGEKLLVSWNNTVLFDESDQTIGIASLGTDITQLRKATALIHESLERLDRAEKVSKSGNWELVLGSNVMKASVGAGLIYGIKGEEFDYEHLKGVPLPEYRQFMDETMKNLIADNQPYDIEFKIKAVDTGEIKDLHSKAFFDAKKRIVFGVIQDITEKKKIFDQLQESEQKLSTLFANMSEMVVIHEMIFDDNGQAQNFRLLECNNAYFDISGISREKAIGKLATEVYQTPIAPYIDEYAQVCKTGKTAVFQTYFAPFDRHFLVSAISLGGNRFSTVSNDITEIFKSQEEVLRTNQELENYMYVASHDLRSPLVNIQGFSQRLSKQNYELNTILDSCSRECEFKDKMLELLEDKIPNSLQYIQTNVSKMDKLINGLLQISRTGRMIMDIRLVDMNNLIENVLNAYNYQLTEIEATVSKEELSDCYGDENQLNQLFSNLIGNAIKYRDQNRKLQLEISSNESFNKVTYAVKDNGIGIHPRNIEKIWDVFYRVDASDPDAGDGLGLSVARRIIDKHKGHISVESTEGVGSTFFVELSLSAQAL